MRQKIIYQRGYILMITLVLLVVGAATWFSSGSLNLAEKRSFNLTQSRLDKMKHIKEQLLLYASMTDTIMQTDSYSSPPPVMAYNRVPAPGYLPCWDTDGDGKMDCSFTPGDYHPHYLPYQISTRHLFFGNKSKQYYYVLDQRFAVQNSNYNNGSTKRYAPLNPFNPSPYTTLVPELKLNDDGKNYVALIIYANGGLDAVNNDGDKNFKSQSLLNSSVDDLIVGITEDEWKQNILRRINNLKDKLCSANSTAHFWFNDYDATNNPAGSNWRSYFNNSGVACP